jgi:hypothetical protein
MVDRYLATNQLRFVVRTEYQETGSDTFVRLVRSLQQLWQSVDGDPDEWRDVPEIDEERV